MLLDEELTKDIIAACIEVHKTLGPGLMESAYEQCVCHELALRGHKIQRQVPLPVEYKGLKLDCAYRMDIVVNDRVVLELKATSKLTDIDKAQLLTYLKLSRIKIGLLINFNVPVLRDGLVRMVL